ncbi:chemotaxis protein [Vibrio amylolyticus]|uniref:chemotaxis protein n=1 Tax=Vibrio amylolyticus TaxID=2847292 RepID=UPI00355116CB
MLIRNANRWIAVALVLILNGCSLLELKLESHTTPLTTQELNMRLLTREYAQQFFSQVESAADTVSHQYPTDDTVTQSELLLWKINANEGMQAAAYQVSPMAALIDTWVFTYQMNDYLGSEGSASSFKTEQVFLVSKQLSNEMENLAKVVLKPSAYQETQSFVRDFAARHPFTDLSFTRFPAYRAWLEANDIDASEAITSLGTMPEALADVSDKLSLVSEQTPKVMTWKAQLIALNSSISAQQLTDTLQSFQASSRSFQEFVENNPEYMRNLAELMAIELQPLVNDIDNKAEEKLGQLSMERKAIEKMVEKERIELIAMIERERNAIADIVASEREQFALDLNAVSQDVVNVAIEKIVELMKSFIVYFIVFIIVIFFVPLGLGYFLGRRSSQTKP